jgi:high-affinity iron transporter
VLAALIIVFREVFEAALIAGIVLAVTRGVPHRGWWVFAGVAGGTLGACLVALFAEKLSQAFEGVGQELFNAGILGVAAVMLTWHNVWMARHGRELAAEMRAAGESVVSGASSLMGLTIVVGVAVLREGVEVVLFLYGILAADTGGGFGVFIGGLVGLALGGSVGALAYFGLLRIASRHLFAVTSVMIAFLAAGMALQATAFLEQANAVTAFGGTVWDTSKYLSDSSVPGRALRTLIGYSDRPTAMELTVYLVTLVVIFALMKLLSPPQSAQPARAH